MVTSALVRALHHISRSSGALKTFKPRSIFPSVVKVCGSPAYFHSATGRMATSADLARVKAKAEKTEKILSDLQDQIEAIKKAAVKQASLGEEEQLAKENEELKKEIEAIRKELIMAEIGNGVRQVQMPTRGALSAITASVSAATATSSTPVMNGNTAAAEPKSDQKAQGKKGGAAAKKTKQTESPEAGGKKAKTEKKDKPEKGGEGDGKPKKAGAATSAAGDAGDAAVDISRLDMRVGKIVAVDKHPDADTLYVEQVDLGEGRNRTIVSGLVKHFPVSAMKDRIAVFMCNLKPAKMRGILSEGMIMCAVSPDKTEILVPPSDSEIGDRVTVEEYPGTPDTQLNPKKKIWETLKPDVKTNSERVATFKGAALIIKGKGPVVAPTLINAQIS